MGIVFEQVVFVDVINDLCLLSVWVPPTQKGFALQQG